MSDANRLRCVNCGREAAVDDGWGSATHPTLGAMTQCPDCGSTNVQTRR